MRIRSTLKYSRWSSSGSRSEHPEVSVVERQFEVGHRACHAHVATVGVDGTPSRWITHVVNGDLAHEIGPRRGVRPEIEFSGDHFVITCSRSRTSASSARCPAAGCSGVIRAWEDLVLKQPLPESRQRCQRTGWRTLTRLTPLAFKAVISFSAARRLNAYNVATSTAIGASTPQSGHGQSEELGDHQRRQSLADKLSEMLTDVLEEQNRVSAVRANVSGPKCSLRT